MIIEPLKKKTGEAYTNYEICKFIVEIEDTRKREFEEVGDKNQAYKGIVDEQTLQFARFVADAETEAEGQIRFQSNLETNSKFENAVNKLYK